MDAARGRIVKLPHGLVAMRISALASSTIARASTKRKGEGAHGGRITLCGSSARCSCTYAWQESCQVRASIRRHTRRSIHGDVPPVMPGNPHLLPSVTFPLYDCTLDPPMSAPADALWEVLRCLGAFVYANGPQASTEASLWSPGTRSCPERRVPFSPSSASLPGIGGVNTHALAFQSALVPWRAGHHHAEAVRWHGQERHVSPCRRLRFPFHPAGRGRFSPSLIS
jgi:hypothetical protein